jgi:hypothetical protein
MESSQGDAGVLEIERRDEMRGESIAKVLVILLPVLFAVSGALGEELVQWRTEDGGNGHWYEGVYVGINVIHWPDARDAAEAQGGYLVTIHSEPENDFVYDLVSDIKFWTDGTNGPWLGGYQPPHSHEPDGNWQWVTGEPWTYTNWAPGEPNNYTGNDDSLHFDAGFMEPPGPTWNDAPGTINALNGYVVEYDLLPGPLEIGIDIKPSSDPNSINLCSKGVVPVAILGSDTFDVEELDQGTLMFAGASPKEKGKSGKVGSFEDVNDDQFLDLILHFPTPELDIEGDAEEALLTGFLNDGTEINGNDTVRIVKSADMGDCNLDGAVDVGDLGIVAYHYGHGHRSWTEGDFNGDAHVDVADLGILADSRRGDIAAAGVALDVVPEPATLGLFALGGILLLRGRRKL